MSNETQASTLPLNPLHLPEAPSWLPLSWGWWAIIASVLLCALLALFFMRWKKRRLAPKKTALRMLTNDNKPSEAIELVRQAALCYFPREEIAQLTGKEWYQFLDAQTENRHFSDNFDVWQQALYSKQPVAESELLIDHCRDWIENALPPKRRKAVRG